MDQTSNSNISSLPVAGIIGSQLQVDGVYHDLTSDLVYVFSGMIFFKYRASEFKVSVLMLPEMRFCSYANNLHRQISIPGIQDGSFKPQGQALPPMLCINKRFLSNCKFDRAYPNPCSDEHDATQNITLPSDKTHNATIESTLPPATSQGYSTDSQESRSSSAFHEQQQLKLRLLAGRAPKLLSLLDSKDEPPQIVEATSHLQHTPDRHPISRGLLSEDKIIRYLLITVAMLIITLALAFILLIVVWRRSKKTSSRQFIAALARAQTNSLFAKTNQEHVRMPAFEQMTSKI